MATELKKLPTNTRRKVDWSKYNDGKVWQLKQGRDFPQETAQARAALYAFARRNELTVKVRVLEGGLAIQFVSE